MSFTVIPAAPTITSFNPVSGAAQDAIVITGTNLTSTISVKFNGVPAAALTVDSDTQITATLPTGCSSGLIEITTNGGTVSSLSGFTVTVPGGTNGSSGTAIKILDDSTALTTSVTSINFVGAGVTLSNQGDAVTVNISDGGVSSGAFNPVIKTESYTAKPGDVIIAETSNASWDLTLPENPAFGDPPITIYGGSDFSINPLILNLGNGKYQKKVVPSKRLKLAKAFAGIQLVYAGTDVGWLSFPEDKLAATKIYSQEILQDNPYLYWRLRELSGVNAFDSSPNNRSGTYTGGYTLGSAGSLNEESDTSPTFDGTTGRVYQNINQSTLTTFTASIRFKTAVASNQGLINFGSSFNTNSASYSPALYINSLGKLVFYAYDGSVRNLRSTLSYNDGNWHSAVIQANTGTMNLFVNGELIASISIGTLQSFIGYWQVGFSEWFNGSGLKAFFNGQLGEFSIFNTFLSANRIQIHYQTATADFKP